MSRYNRRVVSIFNLFRLKLQIIYIHSLLHQNKYKRNFFAFFLLSIYNIYIVSKGILISKRDLFRPKVVKAKLTSEQQRAR